MFGKVLNTPLGKYWQMTNKQRKILEELQTNIE